MGVPNCCKTTQVTSDAYLLEWVNKYTPGALREHLAVGELEENLCVSYGIFKKNLQSTRIR